MTERFPSSPHAGSHYLGPAVITVRGEDVTAEIELKGYREPIDGVYRWMGRISSTPSLMSALGDQMRVRARITTDHSSREAWIGDPDPWGRLRVTGKSTPPFAVPSALVDSPPHPTGETTDEAARS
ncbi:MAG: DUF4873 domain-containing protein [Rhodococcus sp. (in: high G+C Gram-positive bacteria)]